MDTRMALLAIKVKLFFESEFLSGYSFTTLLKLPRRKLKTRSVSVTNCIHTKIRFLVIRYPQMHKHARWQLEICEISLPCPFEIHSIQ